MLAQNLRPDLRPGRTDWLTPLIVFGPLILTTYFAKVGMPVGPRAIPASLYGILVLLALGVATSRLVIDLKRLGAFILAMSFLGGVMVLRGDEWSVTSFLMMASLYATYTVSVTHPQYNVKRGIEFFLNVAAIIAVGGIAQFFLQFVIGPRLAFPVDYLLPAGFLVEKYMNLNVLHYGSTIHKPNGIFLLEASFFSQLLAIAVLAELLTSNRMRYLILFMAGMVVSYSGTGIIVLAVTMPFLVVTQKRWDLILLALGGLVAAALMYEALNLEIFVTRATEFGHPRSSGFMRFVGAYYMFDQFLWVDQWRSLFGYGAGVFKDYEIRTDLPVHESALTKIVFEFGLIGALVNIGFLFFCVARSSAPGILKLGVAVMFFMAGIYTPSSHGIALTIMMWPSPAPEPLRAVERSTAVLKWFGIDFSRVRVHAANRRRIAANKQT
ncbi:MAG: hypothetical protein ACRBC3_12810 [Burkholderiaceae bacterium]